ncbi:unnamed protein product [Blepharisma stoltei]|uniref:Uncharacterized protein n=1 Tax=Blepharisma stoltei TaxID=1481888 RepID=A0AAU9I7V4_9CILI|nr:unnamed protein product [Blepharisma stoltei]
MERRAEFYKGFIHGKMGDEVGRISQWAQSSAICLYVLSLKLPFLPDRWPKQLTVYTFHKRKFILTSRQRAQVSLERKILQSSIRTDKRAMEHYGKKIMVFYCLKAGFSIIFKTITNFYYL